MPAEHNGSRVASAAAGDPADVAAGREAESGALTGVAQHLDELISAAGRLVEVHIERRRLATRRTVVESALVGLFALVGAIWLGAAALATVHGLSAALGELAGGALALLLAACGIGLALRGATRLELRRLERKEKHGRPGGPHA